MARECIGCNPGDELQTLTRCDSCRVSQLYEAFGWKPNLQLNGYKGKILFLFFLKLCFSFYGMMRADIALTGGGVV